MNSMERQLIQRAQRHGWRVAWVGECVLREKGFYRTGHRPRTIAIHPNGKLASIRS